MTVERVTEKFRFGFPLLSFLELYKGGLCMFKLLKSKKGFTLVELLIIVLVIGIVTAVAIPAFGSYVKVANAKVCRLQREDLEAQAQNWCMRNNFNDTFDYAITSDDDMRPEVIAYQTPLSDDQITLLATDIHPNICCCPAGGTYTLIVTPQPSGIPIITCVCDCEDHINPDANQNTPVMPLAE